jgi:hypothetical protein
LTRRSTSRSSRSEKAGQRGKNAEKGGRTTPNSAGKPVARNHAVDPRSELQRVLDIFDLLFFHPLFTPLYYRPPSHEERKLFKQVRKAVLPVLRTNLLAFGIPEPLVEHFLDFAGRFDASPFEEDIEQRS